MKPIDIQINNAKITNYSVELKEDKMPEVTAAIGLYCGSKRISSFRLTTSDWMSDSIVFELPPNMIQPIVDISKQLEAVLVRECNKQLKQLPAVDAKVVE